MLHALRVNEIKSKEYYTESPFDEMLDFFVQKEFLNCYIKILKVVRT